MMILDKKPEDGGIDHFDFSHGDDYHPLPFLECWPLQMSQDNDGRWLKDKDRMLICRDRSCPGIEHYDFNHNRDNPPFLFSGYLPL